jgi:hypothetical protein
MNILKYLLSRSYRARFMSEYTKEICDKISEEQKLKQDIYEAIFGNKATT